MSGDYVTTEAPGSRSVPTTQACTVWWAAPVDPEDAPPLVALLDGHEVERMRRFRRAADRARYLAAHALARLVLAEAVDGAAVDLVFDRTCRCGEQHGKPVLAGGPCFSLTHAGDVVGVALHAEPVGLDVEQVRHLSDLTSMADHACSPAETAPDPDSFFTLWTRKEAVLKATGHGLSVPMASVTVGATGVRDWAGDTAPTEPVWLRDLRPVPGYAAAVAGVGQRPDVQERDGTAALRATATP